MVWTKQHDVLLCREALLIDVFQFRPGTRERGHAWESIAADLTSITEVDFYVNKRSVRERLTLLIENFKKHERYLEKASGVDVEVTELDQLLLELKEKMNEYMSHYDTLSAGKKQKEEKDKEAAEEQRKRAMETFVETKRRDSSSSEIDEEVTPTRKSRKSGSDTLVYLREKADRDFELKQEELRIKSEETKLFREMMAQQTQLIQTLVANMKK